MRKFNVNVNGKSYYVEIEEAGASSAPIAASAPAPAPAPVAAPAPAVNVNAGGTAVTAPMPGQVLDFAVSNGATVKKGDKVLILEAMKMENEIVASADGVITFAVKKGDSVESGATLAYIK